MGMVRVRLLSWLRPCRQIIALCARWYWLPVARQARRGLWNARRISLKLPNAMRRRTTMCTRCAVALRRRVALYRSHAMAHGSGMVLCRRVTHGRLVTLWRSVSN